MKTNQTDFRPEDGDRQPRMARMTRMKKNFFTECHEPIRTNAHCGNGFIVSVIREIPEIRGQVLCMHSRFRPLTSDFKPLPSDFLRFSPGNFALLDRCPIPDSESRYENQKN